MEEMFDVLNEYGEYTGEVASRSEAHHKGLWHKAVVVFIVNSKNEVLIQQRSANKKLWPNKWDITAGGHVFSGEFGYQSVIRETKEEIGLDIQVTDLLFIGATTSINTKEDIINRHYNEYFIVRKDVNLKEIQLEDSEVQDIKWISKNNLIKMIDNRDEELTDKWGCWDYLKKYLEIAC